jgi:spermidine synthase
MKTLVVPLLIVSLCSAPLNRAASSKEPRPSIGEVMSDIGFYQSIHVAEKPLVDVQSEYQKIQIYFSEHYGKILVLDNVIQLTERDANAYNEMMAHLPLFQHLSPKRVLIIGGGDGYILREVLKHPSVQMVDHVDLDSHVIRVCQEHLDQDAWDDGRVKLHIQDGADYVKRAPSNYYDVIIQDSSDPWTWDDEGVRVELPSRALYEASHLQELHRVLSPNGVLCLQAESLQVPSDVEDIVGWRRDAHRAGFSRVRYASIMVSSYPTGQIGCFVCEKEPSRLEDLHISERYQDMVSNRDSETSFYHPRLQSSAFDLPLWAEKKIYGAMGPEASLPSPKLSLNAISNVN